VRRAGAAGRGRRAGKPRTTVSGRLCQNTFGQKRGKDPGGGLRIGQYVPGEMGPRVKRRAGASRVLKGAVMCAGVSGNPSIIPKSRGGEEQWRWPVRNTEELNSLQSWGTPRGEVGRGRKRRNHTMRGEVSKRSNGNRRTWKLCPSRQRVSSSCSRELLLEEGREGVWGGGGGKD